MELPHDLGGGLVLRRAKTEEDIARIIELDNTVVQEENPVEDVSGWIRSMADGDHPTTTPRDFYLVEDTTKDLFVSSTVLIPQVWAYEDISFGVGRPEIVMTLPDYRRRGLVRAQFEALHADCAARDLPVQAITGIPYFYRLFDYEYALALGGGCDFMLDMVPKLEGDELYTIRPLAEADLSLAMALSATYAQTKIVTSVSDEALWRHITGDAQHIASESFYVVEREGRMAGYFNIGDMLWFGAPIVYEIMLAEDTPYTAVLPSILRELARQVEARWPDKELKHVQFELGDDHPAYPILTSKYRAKMRALPYAWYIRVPDVPGFIRHIKPALERHLAVEPVVAGYSGDIRIGFYRCPGLRLKFEAGKLTKVRVVEPAEKKLQAAFPPLVFLKLLFGYRDFDELKYIYPDVWANPEAKLVLSALFPKRPSWVRQID